MAQTIVVFDYAQHSLVRDAYISSITQNDGQAIGIQEENGKPYLYSTCKDNGKLAVKLTPSELLTHERMERLQATVTAAIQNTAFHYKNAEGILREFTPKPGFAERDISAALVQQRVALDADQPTGQDLLGRLCASPIMKELRNQNAPETPGAASMGQ